MKKGVSYHWAEILLKRKDLTKVFINSIPATREDADDLLRRMKAKKLSSLRVYAHKDESRHIYAEV